VTAFVARMNEEAATLGMTSTHYVDTNGLDAGSVSTARDQLVMAEHGMAESGFGSIVDQSQVTLPYTGTLPNYVTAVGTDGVIGVKSGFTDAAMACVVLAAIRQVGNERVVVLAADLGQEEGLDYAQQEDLSMINAVASGLRLQTVVGSHQVVGRLSVGSRPGQGTSVSVETASPLVAVAWPGSNISVYATEDPIGKTVTLVKSGAKVGWLEASAGGGTPISVPIIATAPIRR
jgi:serine-type D-Ala-D-Ala carboxypeptidase (penicillin-binding protein 5/6)